MITVTYPKEKPPIEAITLTENDALNLIALSRVIVEGNKGDTQWYRALLDAAQRLYGFFPASDFAVHVLDALDKEG